jgi:hypothetical protein
MVTKQEIFDLFYQRQLTSRSGGGNAKTKMTRCTVTKEAQTTMLSKINDDIDLLNYYNKLLNRAANLAPPPRPI